MHANESAVYGRRAHWRNHYQREVERVQDELRVAQARRRAWQLQVPDAPESEADKLHIENLRASLHRFRANLAQWSGP
jgi:hypothetical protein